MISTMISIGKSKLMFVLCGLTITFATLQVPVWLAELQVRRAEIQERKDEIAVRDAARVLENKIKALEFDEILMYYDIAPPEPIVGHGAVVRFVSDSEVMPITAEIPEPVKIDWFEAILCDKKPYDGVKNYEYWKQALSTGFSYQDPRPRKTAEELAASEGFLVREKMPEGFTGKPPPMNYPEFDADCILRSHMVMRIGDYSVKSIVRWSQPVKVRKS